MAKVKPILSIKNFEWVIHSFITPQLDHCNGLYIVVSTSSVAHLQRLQSAVARLLTCTKKYECTSILTSLHWLLVHFRIHFKVFFFLPFNGLTLLYLPELLYPYAPSCSLMSADQLLPKVPKLNISFEGIVLSLLLLLKCRTTLCLRQGSSLFLKHFSKPISSTWLLTPSEMLIFTLISSYFNKFCVFALLRLFNFAF